MELRLARIVEESPDVRTLIFEGSVPPYKPGNFFRLWLPGSSGKKSFRPYSAASHPSEGNLRFCIKKRTGASLAAEGAPASSAPIKKNRSFSSRMWDLHEGDSVELDGPHGTFSLGKNDSERVFVAGGVGIAPLRSMIIQTLLDGKRTALFHSAQNLSGIAYIGEMKFLEMQNQSFKYFPAITREAPAEGWGGLNGRITAEEVKRKLGPLEGKSFYLCGPVEMVSGIAKGLLDAGVKKENIRKEEWG